MQMYYKRDGSASRIQARNRSSRSDSVEYTPFKEVRDQDHDEVRSDNSR